MKKILALILALALVLGLATVAFAADGDDPTTGEATEETVKITVTQDASFNGFDYVKVADDAAYDASATYYTKNDNGEFVEANVTDETSFASQKANLYIIAEVESSSTKFTAYQILEATYESNTSTGVYAEAEAFVAGTTYYTKDENGIYTAVEIADAEAFAAFNGGPLYYYKITTTTDKAAYYISKQSPWLPVLQDDAQVWLILTETADGKGYVVTWNEVKTVQNDDGTSTTTGYAQTEENARALAAYLNSKLATLDVEGIEFDVNDSAEVEKGYYLIVSSMGSNLILATTDIVFVEKNQYPTLEKEIEEADESAEIGSIVTYKLTVAIPEGANLDLTLTDAYTSGLTPVVDDNGKVAITVVEIVDDEEVASNVAFVPGAPDEDSLSFTITLAAAKVAENAGKTFVIRYQAEINDEAAIVNVQENTATLDYGNDYTFITDSVTTETEYFTFDKVDGNDLENDTITRLEGAEFELYRYAVKDGKISDELEATPIGLVAIDDELVDPEDTSNEPLKYKVYRFATPEDADDPNVVILKSIITTGKNPVKIVGADEDMKYALVEKEAPKGYNKLEEPVPVEFEEDALLDFDVPNYAGTVLPSTGGIGTTIFYIVGSMMAVGAGIVLVTKKRLGVEG